MGSELGFIIDQVSREKGIDPEEVVSAIEEAVVTAARKHYKKWGGLAAKFNSETGKVDLYGVRYIVESVQNSDQEISLEDAQNISPEASLGGSVQTLLSSRALGRIEAQTAKQIIFQRVKEAERKKVHDEYMDRIGEIVNGTVKSVEKGDLIIDLITSEALLPRSLQSPAERYERGENVRAIIIRVHRYSNDPQVILSRTDPRLLMKLFESEVPEIYEGSIEIKAAVREPGDRAKIAVARKDTEIDPVGACVGIKGSRVQSVINELHGERIDIIEWTDDIIQYACNALKPAKVAQVGNVNEEERRIEIIVEDDQLSLAIGKKGQNVRLASKLTGWRIDIKSVEEKKQEEEELSRWNEFREKILNDPNLGEEILQSLEDAGWSSPARLRKLQSAGDLPFEEEVAERIYQEVQLLFQTQVAS